MFTVEKFMPKYLVFVKIAAPMGEEFWKDFSELPNKPMDGVETVASYSVLGYWNFAIIFKADNNDSALHFIGEKPRYPSRAAETNITPLTVLKEHKKH